MAASLVVIPLVVFGERIRNGAALAKIMFVNFLCGRQMQDRNLMKKTIGIICGAALFIAASFSARAQNFIYDQQSATNPTPVINGNADGLYIQTEPLLQSFVPTLTAISFIQLEFEDVPDNGNSGVTLYVNLWTGSPNVNSATLLGSTISVYLPNNFQNNDLGVAGITNFFFSTPITLTVGQTYYLQPVVQSGDNPWAVVSIGNTYPNGRLYASGVGLNTDLWFREGIIPEPTTLALIGLGGILAFALRRRSKTTLLNLIAALLFAIALPSRAQTFIYDQQSATAGISLLASNADGLRIQTEPLLQSFVPSLSAISFVQLQFWDVPLIGNGTAGATVYVNLWTGSPNVNSATLLGSTLAVYMPDGFGNASPGVTNFFFSTPITLTVGQTYYLQPVVQSGDNPWDVINIGDTYSDGQLYGSGAFFQPSTDLWFREGIIATPEPTTLALIGLGGILAFALRRRSKTTLLNLIAALLFAIALPTRAQNFIYDQQSATNPISPFANYVDGLGIQTDPLTQSFVPSLSAISFVQLEFWDFPGNGTAGATVYVNLWTGSPNVNSATLLGSTLAVYMPNNFQNNDLGVAGITNFFFSTPITLTVGQTYYLQPVVQSGDNPWAIVTIGDTYSNGQLYGDGAFFQPSTDLWFREGIIATPEPTTLALVGLGGILAFVLRRRSKLFLLPVTGVRRG